MAKTFSLCLTTKKINDNDRTILFRLADIKGDELKEYSSYDLKQPEDCEENVYMYPKALPANYIIGELKIWEWDPFVKEWAKKTLKPFYELVGIPEVNSLTEERVIRLLKEGYAIPNYFGQKGLLVINEDEESYRVIELDSNVIKNINGVIKLDSNSTSSWLNGYILNKKDFISTEKVIVLSPEGERIPPRKVYKYLTMPKPDFFVETLSFNEKIELFINKQIKIRSFTKAQQREIKNLFIEILSDYDKISEFFRENEFSRDGLLGKINNVRYTINDVLGDENKWDKFCEVMMENLPELKQKYTKQVEERFKEINKSRLEKEEFEIKDKEKIKDNLINQCNEYETNLTILEKKKEILVKNIKNMKSTYNSLETALANKVTEIKENMAGFISEMSLIDVMGMSGTKNAKDTKSYYIKLSKNKKDNHDILYDINEFVDVLGENLQQAGVQSDIKLTVSDFITGTLIQKNGLLLVGKFTRNVADAISTTICGMNADIISVIKPEIDLTEFEDVINSCNSQVILIENILNLNEFITLQLLRSDLKKLVLFANDISETVNFIPNSLLNRFNLLCLDFVCEKSTGEEFEFTDASNIKFENKFSTSTYKAAKEELDKLIGKCIYSHSHCSSKSELISVIDDIDENEGLYSWLLCEAIPHQILLGEQDNLIEIIDMLQLSEKHTNKLKKIIG